MFFATYYISVVIQHTFKITTDHSISYPYVPYNVNKVFIKASFSFVVFRA